MNVMLIYNVQQIRKILKDFYSVSGIHIVFFDTHSTELATYPSGQCAFCELIRSSPTGYTLCKQCDFKAFDTALKDLPPHVYRCHAGLLEVVAPVYDGNMLVGFVMAGQGRALGSEKSQWAEILMNCRMLPLDFDALYKEFLKLPPVSEEAMRAAARMVSLCIAYSYKSRLPDSGRNGFCARLQQYIEENYPTPENMSLSTMSKTFGISNSTICHLCKKELGVTVAQLIRRCRVNAAKNLLMTTGVSISEIAFMVGIPDFNYFTKIFKSETGFTPSGYRALGVKES